MAFISDRVVLSEVCRQLYGVIWREGGQGGVGLVNIYAGRLSGLEDCFLA